jgi:excisionase family DNA binding protein
VTTQAVRLYTPREAAAILKVHERTVLRWVESGRLPARRIGRLIRIEEPVLSAYGEATTPARKAGRPPGAAKTHKPKGEPRKGSPAALLRHCGRLNEQDVEAMMQAISRAHVVDWEAPVEVPA